MKSEILTMLCKADGYVSGQELCKQLGVSRTTVWNVINKLKEEGYEIEAISNKGYCLKNLPDQVTQEACFCHLNTEWAGRAYYYYEEVDSTNTKAKQLGEEGAVHGTLVAAEQQSSGKGRRGRTWSSPKGDSIYMTLLLRPDIEPHKASMLTLVAALSVSDAIERITGLKTQIKWPNDIVSAGRKLCGILTEMSADMDGINYVVIGIGINCNQAEVPKELQEVATSLKKETGQDILRSVLIAGIMERFEIYYESFMKMKNLKELKEPYESRLVNRNRQVRVLAPGREYTGISRGIDEMGELLVEDESGEVHTVFSGEVSVRGIYGYV